MATAFFSDDDEQKLDALRSTSLTETECDDIPKYPLRIFHETSEEELSISRSRGRSRGRGRGRGLDRRPASSHRHAAAVDAGEKVEPERGRGRSDGWKRGGRGNTRRPHSQNRAASDGSDFKTDPSNVFITNSRGQRHGRVDHSATDITAADIVETRVQNTRERAGRATSGAPRRFTLKKLIALSRNDDPDALLQEIAHSKSGFEDVLSDEIKPDWLYNILKILSTITDSSQQSNLVSVLVKVESIFLNKLNEVLGEISLQSDDYRQIWNNTKSLANVCSMILKLLKSLVQAIHNSLGKCKSTLTIIQEIISIFAITDEAESLQEEIKSVNEIIRALIEEKNSIKSGKHNQKKVSYHKKEEEGLPPEDFRELSVLPAVRDVQMDEKPFLRANRAKGKYENLDTYLDIQFRLLREDFMQPLRIGISEYIHSLGNGKTEHKFREIRLYKNVQIMRPVCTHDGINYVIQFDVSSLKRVNWSTSRRLLYGSLVCLSSDNFQTIYYATVKDRNIKDLNEGFLRVYFESMPETGASDTFLMAESTSYFEAFRHVLFGLQSTDSSLPFQRYIVECNTNIKPPSYLLTGVVPVYDFRSILPKKTKAEYAGVPVLTTTRWPTEVDLGLDTTQHEALKLAITKEMAIIQGPPGTGKTFIGLKIAKVLIANKSLWKPNKKGSPILVVCYTNHALDQFLEGILSFCSDGIVRVGGRCQSTMLEPYILRNLKQTRKKERKRTFGILQLEKDCLRSINQTQEEIHNISSELKKTYTEIISFEKLKMVMTSEQEETFERSMKKELKRNYMAVWLQFRPETFESSSDNDQSKESIAKAMWTSHILESVDEMSTDDRGFITDDPISIPLTDRARLYKSWLAEFKAALKTLESSDVKKEKDEAKSMLSLSEKQIVGPNHLFHFVSSINTKSEIARVASKVTFETWLAVDGSSISMAEIKSVLAEESEKERKYTSEDSDMEEDRELDSDEDDMMVGYDDDDWKVNIPKVIPQPKEDDWILKWNAKKERTEVRKMLNSADIMTDKKAQSVFDVCKINISYRRNLYKYWIGKYRELLKLSVKEAEKIFNSNIEQLREVREAETYEILQEAKVIGMTTTGAAKHRKALQKVKPAIVIVEEAAEVLESHIITALSEGCKHLILIGDHKQLRPSTTVYELAKRYQLDISLFERMIRNDIPCVTLLEQHRMRPEISILLKTEQLYPNLKDHKVVNGYEKVRGIDEDVFFIEHDKSEVRGVDSTSYHNPHEASFLAGLCKYLLQQGYDRTQITVLSPYMGQVSLLRKAMPKNEFEGVRITAVDNYQGEENDIILLSLVRSSEKDFTFKFKKNPIGFLGIENRICVALSRAKMGLYVIGNFSLLEEYSGLWQYMVQRMTEAKRIGKELVLRCENHPHKIIKASLKDDFENAPDGGCKEPCGGRLPNCDHICPRVCHVVDKKHEHAKCLKPCTKVFEKCLHRCLKKCFQDCGKCETKVKKQIPMCNHTALIPCHADPYTWNCVEKCNVQLPCGHECGKRCNLCVKSSTHESRCMALVKRSLPCGHSMELNCYKKPTEVICPEPCQTTLMCGHPCSGSCGHCLRGKVHKLCMKACRKVLPCGHKCSNKCSDLCPPCTLPCEWVCSHLKKCTKRCFETCDACPEECQFKCPHSKCSMLCYEMCDKNECNEKCRKELKCGHPCTGLCNEPCICSEFCSEKENKYRASYEEGTSYIRIYRCKCIVPQVLLDRHIRTATSTRNNVVHKCPNCNKPISSENKRYSNELKERRQEVIEKFKMLSGSEKEKIEKRRLLQREIEVLGQVGLGKTYQTTLQERLKQDEFGTLHIVGQVVTLLKMLLPAYQRLVVSTDIEYVIKPEILVGLILRKYKYGTTQLWTELRQEVKRVVYLADLLDIQKKAMERPAESDLQRILDKTLKILNKNASITEEEMAIIEKVISKFK